MKLYKKPRRRFVGIAGTAALLTLAGVVVACPSGLIFADSQPNICQGDNSVLGDGEVCGFGNVGFGFTRQSNQEVEGSASAEFGFTRDSNEAAEQQGSVGFGFTRDSDEVAEQQGSVGFGFNSQNFENAEDQKSLGFGFNVVDYDGISASNQVDASFTVVPTISIGTGEFDTGKRSDDDETPIIQGVGYKGEIEDVDVYADASKKSGFATGSTDFKVRSNSPTGFAIFVTGGDLLNPDNSTAKISPIQTTSGILPTAFNDNTWGYNISSSDSTTESDQLQFFSPVSPDSAYHTPGFSGEANLKLTIGTKINNKTAPGTYSNTVEIRAVVNPTTLTAVFSE